MGLKLRQHRIMISVLAAFLLLPYVALMSDLPSVAHLNWTSGAISSERIAPENTEDSAAMFGTGVPSAVFQERGSFFYSPLHLFSYVNLPQELADAVSLGRFLSFWILVAYIILMLATVYRFDGKKGAAWPFA